MNERQKQALELSQQGKTDAEIGKVMGISPNAAQKLKTRAKANVDPAILAAMAAAGTEMVPTLAWAKTKSEDGTAYSVLLRPKAEDAQSAAELVRQAFEDLEPTVALPDLAETDDRLMTLYPLADVHLGMQAWGREVGQAYDTNIALRRLREGMAKCLASAPASAIAVVLNAGDFTHANDDDAVTPQSKHSLDVDTRHWKTMEAAVQVTVDLIEMALTKHQTVVYRALRGNHDPATPPVLTFALKQRYRDEPRVVIEDDPSDFWVMQHGTTMLACHHGDKAKPERLVLDMADRWAKMWGETRHRFYFTGHKHHHQSQDIGGVKWEQLRAITSKDAYASSHSYSARSEMVAMTFDLDAGEVSRSIVSL